jgi:hypothetical protein
MCSQPCFACTRQWALGAVGAVTRRWGSSPRRSAIDARRHGNRRNATHGWKQSLLATAGGAKAHPARSRAKSMTSRKGWATYSSSSSDSSEGRATSSSSSSASCFRLRVDIVGVWGVWWVGRGGLGGKRRAVSSEQQCWAVGAGTGWRYLDLLAEAGRQARERRFVLGLELGGQPIDESATDTRRLGRAGRHPALGVAGCGMGLHVGVS